MSEPIQSISQGNYILQGTVATSAGIVGDGSTQNPLRADETVLWETTANDATACTFSENWQNFEKIDVYAITNDNIGFVTTFPNYSRIGQVTLRYAFYSTAYGVYDKLATFNMTTGGMTSLKQCVARFGPGSAQYSFITGDGIWLKKVIGINRISG